MAGILQDFLFTLSLRYVSKEMPPRPSLVAFFDNFVSVEVLYNIIRRIDDQKSRLAILIYSLGIATGTYLTMRFKINKIS